MPFVLAALVSVVLIALALELYREIKKRRLLARRLREVERQAGELERALFDQGETVYVLSRIAVERGLVERSEFDRLRRRYRLEYEAEVATGGLGSDEFELPGSTDRATDPLSDGPETLH